MRSVFAAIAIGAAAASAAVAQPSRPVMIGPLGPHARVCLSLAEVTGLNRRGDNFLSVRAAPNARARELDRLEPNRAVLICGMTRDGKWAGIVYGRSDADGCGVEPSEGRPRPYAGPCRSGWAAARYLSTFGD